MRSRPPTSQRTRSGHGGAFRCAPPGRARPPKRGTSERHEPAPRDYRKAPPPWHEKVAPARGAVRTLLGDAEAERAHAGQIGGLLTDAAYAALCLGSDRDATDFAARATPIALALDNRF